jgi:meiosis-specific APC/C activator protein AMA1
VGTVLGPLDQNSGEGEVHNINGAAWMTGGLAPSGTAVNNGRGQLVSSGTNAQLFRTSFSTSKPTMEEEIEKHEARIATALGLDRVRRTLDVPKPLGPEERTRSRDLVSKHKTHWNGIEWINNEPIPSKSLLARVSSG